MTGGLRKLTQERSLYSPTSSGKGQDSIGDPANTAASARDRRFATSAGELVSQPLFPTVIDYNHGHICGQECKQNERFTGFFFFFQGPIVHT